MATVGSPKRTTFENVSTFHLRMALLFIVIAFGGFASSYWLKLLNGSFYASPIIHIHGILFFVWTLFYLFQTWLIATNRTFNHRNLGMAGISLFSVMMCSVIAARITMMKMADANGFGDAGRRFAIFNAFDIVFMSITFALAIANVSKPERHKRLMLLLCIAMMPPAVARIILTIIGGEGGGTPPPVIFGLLPNLIAYLPLITIPMLHDRLTTGRIHHIYIVGSIILVAGKVTMIPLAGTSAWMSVADAAVGIVG